MHRLFVAALPAAVAVPTASRQPAWIDFVIERCRCAYEGATSRDFLGWQGLWLLVAATAPGNPRSTELDHAGSQLLRIVPQAEPPGGRP